MAGRVCSPCLDCEERREACHAVCEHYKAFEKQNAKERAEYNSRHFLTNYTRGLVYYPTSADFRYRPDANRPKVYKTHKK